MFALCTQSKIKITAVKKVFGDDFVSLKPQSTNLIDQPIGYKQIYECISKRLKTTKFDGPKLAIENGIVMKNGVWCDVCIVAFHMKNELVQFESDLFCKIPCEIPSTGTIGQYLNSIYGCEHDNWQGNYQNWNRIDQICNALVKI